MLKNVDVLLEENNIEVALKKIDGNLETFNKINEKIVFNLQLLGVQTTNTWLHKTQGKGQLLLMRSLDTQVTLLSFRTDGFGNQDAYPYCPFSSPGGHPHNFSSLPAMSYPLCYMW